MAHQEVTGRRARQARPPGAAEPILTRQMVLLLITSMGSLGSFYLLVPVVPLYAATTAGGVGAGLSTGAMMLATVLTELAVPRLLGRHGYRAVMALGLVLLGAPALLLTAWSALPLVLGVCLVRGAGLGIAVVAGTALIADLTPAARRGEGLGLYGVAVGVPSIACLPLGLWLTVHLGYRPVFVAAAALSLLALAAAAGLPARPARTGAAPSAGTGSARTGAAPMERPGLVLGVLRLPGLVRPAVVFAAVTLAAGVLLTFLPLAMSPGSRHLAAVALLVQSCATPLSRWIAGRYADRHGSARLLVPAVLAAALGTAGLVRVDSPPVVVACMGLFGIGFGIAQNVTLGLMFERVPRPEFGRVSALWNLAYDAGMGVGAVGFGLLAGPVGYPRAFALTGAVLFVALVPAWRDRPRAARGEWG